jgi:hypothetical protein
MTEVVTPPASEAAPGAEAAAAAAAAQAAAPAAPVRPEGLADQFWDATAGVKTTDLIAHATALEAAETARKAGVPADAAGYKLDLAEPVMGADGKTPVAFNADDPMAKGALDWAAKHQVPQAALSELLAHYATTQVAEMKAATEAATAEQAKLGANATARINAVGSAVTAKVGEAGAKALMAEIGSSAAFEAVEKLIAGQAGPSLASPPPGGAAAANQFEGLHGADLLSAVRAQKAA